MFRTSSYTWFLLLNMVGLSALLGTPLFASNWRLISLLGAFMSYRHPSPPLVNLVKEQPAFPFHLPSLHSSVHHGFLITLLNCSLDPPLRPLPAASMATISSHLLRKHQSAKAASTVPQRLVQMHVIFRLYTHVIFMVRANIDWHLLCG